MAVRITRQAISPRLAIRILLNAGIFVLLLCIAGCNPGNHFGERFRIALGYGLSILL